MRRARTGLHGLLVSAAFWTCGDTQVGNPFDGLEVCPTAADFGQIQAAITAAEPGATIRVCSGTYAENLTIDKPIHIEAADDGFTLAPPAPTGITVTGDVAVELRRLRIEAPIGTGVAIDGAQVILDDVVIEDLASGDVDGAAAIRCDGCALTINRGRIADIAGLGVWAHQASLVLSGVELANLDDMGVAAIDSVTQLSDVEVDRATIAGVAVYGGSLTGLGAVSLTATRATNQGMGGDGLVVTDTGALVDVDLERLTVERSERLGVVLSGQIDSAIGAGTLAENMRGGLVAQNQAFAALAEVSIAGNTHVGVQALAAEVQLEGTQVAGTVGGRLPSADGFADTGDGLVGFARARIAVDAVTIQGCARSGILMDGAETLLESAEAATSSRDNGVGAVFQNGALGPQPATLIVEDNAEPEQRVDVADERLPMVRDPIVTQMP